MLHKVIRENSLRIYTCGKRFNFLKNHLSDGDEYLGVYRYKGKYDQRTLHTEVHAEFFSIDVVEDSLLTKLGFTEGIVKQIPAVLLKTLNGSTYKTIGTYIIQGNFGEGFDIRKYLFGKLDKEYSTRDSSINHYLRQNANASLLRNFSIESGTIEMKPGFVPRELLKLDV